MYFWRKQFFDSIVLVPVHFILRQICFATLGDKMENNLEKADFT
jgi:hypothetical protein